MEWTSLNDLREKFLKFFESKGHLSRGSYPLVPESDKSLLLIVAGMAPLKKYFTGEAEPPRRRMATCQKCIRTNDIEHVGYTARHGTFFEMLGNFSFGDYFKEEALTWAWEFLTETLAIPADLLGCEFDVGWLTVAGEEPAEWIRRYAGRVPMLHMKDFYFTEPGKAQGKNPEDLADATLGRGRLNVPAVLDAAKDAGVEWLIVEFDEPEAGMTAFECAKESYDYLTSLLK